MFIAQLLSPAFLLHLVIMIGISVFSVLGLNLIFGKGKILHFGPIAVSLVATYGMFLTLEATQSYLLAVPAGLVCSVLLSVLLWWLSLRLEPDGFGVLSIALHLIILSVVLNWTSFTHGAMGIARVPRMPFLDTPVAFAVATAGTACLWVLFLHRLNRGTFGRGLQALAEQPSQAAALGIDRARMHLVAFILGGIGALLANFFYVQYVHLAHPNDFTFAALIFYVTIVVAGKPGSVPGVTLATALLVLLREELRFVPLPSAMIGPVRLLLFGVILLVAVWWRRDTLFPMERKV